MTEALQDNPKDGKRQRNWGCIAAAVGALVVLLFFIWPYRLETVTGVVGAQQTGCTIAVNQFSGWHERQLAPLVHASDLPGPLEVFIFVDCPGRPKGKPYAVELRSLTGKVLASGLECGAAPVSDYPCRIEAPPIARSDEHRFIVRIVLTQGATASDVSLDVVRSYDWRSIVWDVMMSA